MSNTFYISVDDTWYNNKYWSWTGGNYGCEEFVRRETGAAEVLFICNSLAKLSAGDMYRIKLKEGDNELFYLLNTGLTKIDNTIGDAYVASHPERFWDKIKGSGAL